MAKKKKTESEVETPEAEAPDTNETQRPAPSKPTGAFDGARIKKEREKKGMTHEEISARTKISLKVLRALEDERYEDMPNARVYIRGFVRCVARELGLDQDDVSTSYVPRWEAWVARHAEP